MSSTRDTKIISFRGKGPRIHPGVFLADGVCIIGDVEIGADASIWFNTVLRGDINSIHIGDRTNIQDGSTLHVTNTFAVHIGSDVTIGHRAIVHGSRVGDCSLIGMGAILLDNSSIGPQALVAAGAVVRENFVVPGGTMAAGVPARIIRDLTAEEKKRLAESARNYVMYARSYGE